MKKLCSLIFILIGFIFIFAACKREGTYIEDACPYALMHEGVLYYYTGEEIYEKIKITDDVILGKVTSVIPENQMPSFDGQANIDILGSVYIRHALAGEGLLVLINGEWIIFENRDKGSFDDENRENPNDMMSPLKDKYRVGSAENWGAWELGVTYGYSQNLGMEYWGVSDVEGNTGERITYILPSEDGERYIAFGKRAYRAKAGDFSEVKAYRVISAGGKLVSATETEPMTRQTVLEKGTPYTGSLAGEYMCETRKGDDYDALTITHSITVTDDTITSYSYVRATCGGGKYEGSYTYDPNSGILRAELDYTVTSSNGEISTTTHIITGRLLSYGGFVHFILESSDPYIFSLTTDDPFPLTFKM